MCPRLTTEIPEYRIKYAPCVPHTRLSPPPPLKTCVASPFFTLNRSPSPFATHTSPCPSTHVYHIFIFDATITGTRLACSNRSSPAILPTQIFPSASLNNACTRMSDIPVRVKESGEAAER